MGKAPRRGSGSPRQGKAPQGGSRAEPWYLALGTVHTSPHLTHCDSPPKGSPRTRWKPPAGGSPRQGKAPGRAGPGRSLGYLALGTVHTVAQKSQRHTRHLYSRDTHKKHTQRTRSRARKDGSVCSLSCALLHRPCLFEALSGTCIRKRGTRPRSRPVVVV